MDFIKQVTNYEDICKILGCDPNQEPDVSAYDQEDKQAAIATFRIWKASKAAWKFVKSHPDYNNGRQLKWYNWFDMRSKVGSGVGFSFYCSYFDYSRSSVGARLTFPSGGISKHIAKIMHTDWEAAMTIPEK